MPLYSDINSYTPTEKSLLTDVEAIYQSLHNILGTRRYERLFNEDFYTDFEDQLFQIIDDVTSLEILRLVINKIEQFEKRVIIDVSKSDVVPHPDQNKYELKLVFSIKGLDGTQEFTGNISRY